MPLSIVKLKLPYRDIVIILPVCFKTVSYNFWLFSTGGFFCIMTTILVDLKGIENIARAQSISAMSIGLSLLVATPFSGESNTSTHYCIDLLSK